MIGKSERKGKRLKMESSRNKERMYKELVELMQIDVSSGQEAELAEYLVEKLEKMGFSVTRDEAGETFGGVCGNVFAVREGERGETVCFCSHMDRVPGGIGIRPVEENGILKSSGDTILAADDLSGVAAILEGVRQAIESGEKLPKLELLFTVGEEAGLYGAKAFDLRKLESKMIYVLDSPGRIGRIVNGAPGRALLEAQVFGKAAHAGNEPEKGIDAAKIMAEMLATMKTGRLDENTTSNFSNLWTKTAKAMNVVCDHAILRGEMRSRSGEKLDQYEAYFKAHCQEIAEKRGAKVKFMRENTFLPFYVPEEARIIRIARKALEDMGIEVQINAGGGGMDANIFNQQGVECVGIATGYFKNHTTEEYLHLDDFYRSGELVARIIAKI